MSPRFSEAPPLKPPCQFFGKHRHRAGVGIRQLTHTDLVDHAAGAASGFAVLGVGRSWPGAIPPSDEHRFYSLCVHCEDRLIG